MNKELLDVAKRASENAYAPYSNFKLGAALLTKSGNIYSGCNVENSSYGLTNCAERAAIFNAVTAGEKEFEELLIYVNSDIMFTPCGACRQVIREFSKDLKITVVFGEHILETNIAELLPLGFNL